MWNTSIILAFFWTWRS